MITVAWTADHLTGYNPHLHQAKAPESGTERTAVFVGIPSHILWLIQILTSNAVYAVVKSAL